MYYHQRLKADHAAEHADALEAGMINIAYDRLVRSGVTTELLSQAVEIVENKLTDPTSDEYAYYPELRVRSADIIGYEPAKKARDWITYRNAYLSDLKADFDELDDETLGTDKRPTGLEEQYEFYAEKYDDLVTASQRIANEVLQGDETYLRLCKHLQETRMQVGNDMPLDVLKLEKYVVMSGVLNRLDEILKQPETIVTDSDWFYDGMTVDSDPQPFTIHKHSDGGHKTYTLNFYDDETDLNEIGDRIPVVSLHATDTEFGIHSCFVAGEAQISMDAIEVLDLVTVLSDKPISDYHRI